MGRNLFICELVLVLFTQFVYVWLFNTVVKHLYRFLFNKSSNYFEVTFVKVYKLHVISEMKE